MNLIFLYPCKANLTFTGYIRKTKAKQANEHLIYRCNNHNYSNYVSYI
jgi:hypothetical protein